MSLPDHTDLIPDAADWFVYLDGCRFDAFKRHHDRYLSGDLQRTYTGATWTPDYFTRVWPGTYDRLFLHGGAPLYPKRGNDVYDEHDHFRQVPPADAYDWCDAMGTCPPREVARLARACVEDGHEQGVIRFLQPHEPYLGLQISRGRGMIPRTREAMGAGELTPERMRGHYEATLEWALQTVGELVGDLPGDVVVTADHGTCFNAGDCDQLYHIRRHDEHPHLVETPFLEVDACA